MMIHWRKTRGKGNVALQNIYHRLLSGQINWKTRHNTSGGIARSAATVGGAVLCSRVLGLVREQIFAGMFGAGYAYDAFVVAFRIPNLLKGSLWRRRSLGRICHRLCRL